MKKNQELFENIDAYLNGNLVGADLELFENTLKLDTELQEEVEKYRLIKEALKDKDIINFREKLKDIDREIEEEKVREIQPKKSFKTYYRIAAIFIAIVGISSLFWIYQEPDLYAQYYVPYPMNELTRSSEESTIEVLKEVSLQYKRKEYQKTIPVLERLIQEYPNDDRLKLYLGNSYLNTDQEEKAITLFQNIVKNDTLHNDALWFLSLAHVKTENNGKAITFLKELTSYENLYKKSAIDLLEELE
ncbi:MULTISPECIES: tetratricopeptide repeat protein [Aquimarina]|uniref:Tetratricopeptide repeat protein n=1 Tax=Aquimarina algiphila TaxID=2047982 RepID=A0A554VAW7_9FLAO|nr:MULTISPECIES: tetratricopeptide repeat protein [Aquimarina]TSE03454.1 tetratricopeptide repeat protein [Aquimarina algiphila]